MDLTDKQRRFLISNVLPFLEEKNTEGWTRMKSTSNLKQSIYNEFGIHTFIILIKTVLFDGLAHIARGINRRLCYFTEPSTMAISSSVKP